MPVRRDLTVSHPPEKLTRKLQHFIALGAVGYAFALIVLGVYGSRIAVPLEKPDPAIFLTPLCIFATLLMLHAVLFANLRLLDMWRGAFPRLFLSAFLCTICLATEILSFAGTVPYHQAPYCVVHPIRIVQWMVTTPFVVYIASSRSGPNPSMKR
jgi:hypothetical protein